MKLCAALRDSSAIFGRIRHVRSQWRTYTSDVPKDEGDTSTATNCPELAGASHDSERKEGIKIDQEAKTVETAVGLLPLSPVMDPSFWEATQKFKKKKPKPGRPQNSVERQMRANPFAQALATPLRFDAVSRVRLPSFFLQDFDLVAHPETGNPWWVPRSLALDEPPVVGAEAEEAEKQTTDGAETITEDRRDALNEPKEVQQPKANNSGSEKGVAFGPSAHILARRDVLQAFLDARSGYGKANKYLLAASSSPYKAIAGKTIWREDMDTVVLDLMRRQVVQDLLYLSKLCDENKRYYIVKCYGWNDVQYKHKGAVLWFEDPAEDGAGSKNEPGPFATFEFETDSEVRLELKTMTYVPVHNMPMLLGAEHAKRVKNEAAVLRDGSIFMAAGRRTTNLQLKLWRLQGYLADHRNDIR